MHQTTREMVSQMLANYDGLLLAAEVKIAELSKENETLKMQLAALAMAQEETPKNGGAASLGVARHLASS